MKKILTIFRKDLGAWLFLVPSLILFLLMVWEPLLSTIRMAFYQTRGFELVEFVGLDNFERVLTNSQFLKTLKNTVMYVIWSLIIGYLFSD